MEFSLKQLSWIVIGSLGIGGSGYMSMNSKIDDMSNRMSELSIKVAVVHTQVGTLTKQLDRIEEKLNNNSSKR